MTMKIYNYFVLTDVVYVPDTRKPLDVECQHYKQRPQEAGYEQAPPARLQSANTIVAIQQSFRNQNKV